MSVAWPVASGADRDSFLARGFLAVEGAIPLADLADLARRCHRLDAEADRRLDQVEPGPAGDLRVSQSMLEMVWLDWKQAPFHRWALAYASALMGARADLWYNQLLHKPARVGAPTWWHQDGASLEDGVGPRLVSCWMPLDDVGVDGGCMHFLDRGHLDGPLVHVSHGDTVCGHRACDVDPARVVAVPLRKGGVTFHRGDTPHMTLANRSERPRQVLIQRFVVGSPPGRARTAST